MTNWRNLINQSDGLQNSAQVGQAFAFTSDHKTNLKLQHGYNPQPYPIFQPCFSLRKISQLCAGSWFMTAADWSKASGVILQQYHTPNWLWNKFFLRTIPSSRKNKNKNKNWSIQTALQFALKEEYFCFIQQWKFRANLQGSPKLNFIWNSQSRL